MFGKILLLIILVPMLELFILVKIGTMIGFWPTVGICILTGLVGASLARVQGFLTLQRIQLELQQGKMPADKMLDGLLILVGGILLLTPGLITDALGFLMLIPLTREQLKKHLRKRIEAHIKSKGETKYTIIDV